MKTFPQAFIVFVCTMLLALGDLALAYPGALDTTFGGTGKVTTAIRNVNDFGQAVAMQGDGKIVVAGYSGDNSSGTQTKYDFAVVRYNTDGSLDPSFNGTGKVTTDCGGIFDYGYSVAVQSDGKIVVAGYGSSLVRYNTNGSLDTTFNGTGIVSIPISSANSVALQSDGKIVVAGPSFNGTKGEFDFAVVRYTSTGALDTSFNGTGKATTSVSSGDDQNNVVAVQGDGKILIAGYSDGTGNANFAMVRYTPTGALDTSFNGTGKVITDINGGDIGKCMAVQSDGKIVMGGYTDNGTGNNDLVLVRYNANGMLDTSFNGTGIVTDSINNASAKCLTVQSDGKIVVVGAVIVRYNVDGSLDSKYTAFATFGAGQSVALQSDGKIVVAGYYHNGIQEVFAVARYLGDQPPVVVTSAPTGVTKTDATLNGTVNPNRYATTAHFDYGLTTSYGSTTSDQDMGAGLNTLAISSAITGLTVHTTYHYRLVATNSIGTSASSDATFVTANTNPTAPNGTAAATTGDQQTITLAFPSPDADGDTVTVASVAPGAHLTVNSRNGADVTFTPATNFAGNSTLN